MKPLERQKELELEMENKKTYLEIVEAQNNLKLAKIKKNKVAGSGGSLSDNNINNREDNLEKGLFFN